MGFWQKRMISLAKSAKVKSFMEKRASLSRLAGRFVGGSDIGKVLNTCNRLKSDGIYSSLYFLGEYVEDPETIDYTVKQLRKVAKGLAESGLDIHISVDPTQIGLLVSQETMEYNAFVIASEIKSYMYSDSRGCNLLMLDMEDYSVLDSTISLYYKLVAKGFPAALTLQAYLFRTFADLERIVSDGGKVRLVKGAFAESSDIALTSKRKIDESYLKMANLMLSEKARRSGFYPIFATHDHRLVEQIKEIADAKGWNTDRYEFEMCFGVRPLLQSHLAKENRKIRVYVPFGKDWWPYAVRRIGESPKHAWLLLKTIIFGR